MKLLNSVKDYFNNCGRDKLFLTAIPSFLAMVAACNVFTFNLKICLLSFIAAELIQISVKFFDDFFDFVKGYPVRRQRIEETGIRGRFDKAVYYLGENNKKPLVYFWATLAILFLTLLIFVFISFYNRNVIMLLPIIIVLFMGFVNYSGQFKKVINKIGTEIIIAFLCAPVCMLFIFYSSTRCITPQIVYLSLIMFFFVLNTCFISSVLNQKVDIMTDKNTLPVIINKPTLLILLIITFGIIPYLLTFIGIISNIMPKLSYFTFLLIPHSIWLMYLCIQYIRNPQVLYKWHFLMGFDSFYIENEKNGISWYTTRYNLSRNIFFSYTIILIITFICSF